MILFVPKEDKAIPYSQEPVVLFSYKSWETVMGKELNYFIFFIILLEK